MKLSTYIDLRHLRYFVAAAEHGSFRKAGTQIGISESGISRRMRDLEEHLGTLLFQRHNGGVCLTVAGRRFLKWARKINRDVNDGARDVALIGRGQNGWIRVGIVSSLVSKFTVELLGDFSRQHAGVLLEFVDGAPSEHVAAIRQQDLDLAFLTGSGSCADFHVTPLWTEGIFVAFPNDHRLAGLQEIKWQDLIDERFVIGDNAPTPTVRDNLVHRLSMLGHCPDLSMHQVGQDNLLALVALGCGLTLVSEATTTVRFPGLTYRPLTGERVEFGAVWSPRNENPALPHLLRLAKSLSHVGTGSV